MQNALEGEDRSYSVLGVDPAAAGATGFGVVEREGSRCRMLRFGAVRPPAQRDHTSHTHLREIYDVIAGLIDEYRPDALALESVFAALNIGTALRLAEVRGVVLLCAAQAGIPSFSYSPREIKATIAGYGNAGKQQVQYMIRSLLGIGEIPEPPDAADALAVALCHIQMARSEAHLAARRVPEVAPRNRRAASRILVT
jgi:crossover junction endodeoxyribonuclease RuvC